MKNLVYLLEWIAEFVLIITHFPCYILLGYIPMRPHKAFDIDLPPIVMVERWFRKNVFHFYAKHYLEKRGFRVYNVNFPLIKGTYEESGVKLKEYIEVRDLDNFILVGISGGGLTCLEYLENQNGWAKTIKFIGLGAPFRGTVLANAFPLNTSIQEMKINSSYIESLHLDTVKNKDKIYSLHAKSDNMVPVKSSYIPGAHNLEVDVVGHNLFHGLWTPTYEKVVKIITEN